MPHIDRSERNRRGVARWLPGRRRFNHTLSEYLEVEAGRTQHATIAQSRAGARALSPTDRGLAYGCAHLRPRFGAADAHWCEALLLARPQAGEPHAIGQAAATAYFGDELRRGAPRSRRRHTVSGDQARAGGVANAIHRHRTGSRPAPALHRRATRNRSIPSSTSDAWESAAKLDRAGRWPSSREGSETSG